MNCKVAWGAQETLLAVLPLLSVSARTGNREPGTGKLGICIHKCKKGAVKKLKNSKV